MKLPTHSQILLFLTVVINIGVAIFLTYEYILDRRRSREEAK